MYSRCFRQRLCNKIGQRSKLAVDRPAADDSGAAAGGKCLPVMSPPYQSLHSKLKVIICNLCLFRFNKSANLA